jgi:hypothetical protein
VRLETTTEKDLPTIDAWCAYEPYLSRAIYNIAFLTASPDSILCFRLDDSAGPTMFVRVEKDLYDRHARMHILFAPESSVSRMRVAKAVVKTFPTILQHFKDLGYEGLIFDSVSQSLIRFLSKFGFKAVDNTNDFLLKFDPADAEIATTNSIFEEPRVR